MSSMTCPRCRHANRAGAKFCEECATPLARACANCGAPLPATAKFCPECAHPSGGQPADPPYAVPQAYTPAHLAERILTSRSALEGERKQVTVLFADLKGSMELLADRDPEEARAILDPVLQLMMEAVHRYEGTVNQVMGDGIMALFGAPLAHEDHAVRACYAALRMQEAIRRYSDDLRRAQGAEVHVRVGLNSGEVVVRSIGSDLHMDYTAVGQTTHLAARLEQLATPGSTRLSAETLRLAEGYVAVRPLGPVPIKGLPEPVEVYELSGAGPARTRIEAAARRGLSRFVGREAEMEALRRAVEVAARGQGQVVAVVGEPGVGKSRLFWELIHSHRTHGWLILQSGSVSYGKATAYLPVSDLLKAYFQIEPRDDRRRIREKVTGKLLTLDRALEPTLPALLMLLDVATEDPQWEALDPPQRRQRILDGVKRLLLRESQVQPLLVVFEDLHWIDAETQAVLDSLIESLPNSRLLLLVNYRPEYGHGWGSRSYYTQLRLDPLPAESAEELLGALLGGDPPLDPLKRLLIERTQGNPLFLEESVRSLVETQVLAGDPGAYRLVKAVPAIQIPATVQAILAARIDRLAPADKRLLQAAAVIGEDVPLALLEAIADLAEADLRRGLAALQGAEFLYEARLFPEVEYTFKHGLTCQVAYGSLLGEQRRALHARIVAAMEALAADRVAQVERLAHHALRGEVWDKALAYCRQAGARAFAQSANREAVAHFEQALGALAHLPESPATVEQAIDLRFDLRSSLVPLGALDKVLEHLREAERLARALDDRRRLGWVFGYMSHYLWIRGHPAEARSCSQEAQAIAQALGDGPLATAASLYHGFSCHRLGEYREAEDSLRRVVESLEGDPGRDFLGLSGPPAVLSRYQLARALGELGAFDQGMSHAREAMRIAAALDHPYSTVLASWALAELHTVKGEFAEAIPVLERASTLCRDWKLGLLSPLTADMLGYVHALSGAMARGLELLREAVELFTTQGRLAAQPLALVHLGEALLLADRFEDAAANAGQALTLARERGLRGNEAHALRLVAEIASRREPPEAEEAEAHYAQALALATELGMRPLVARCHLGLGRLHRRAGARERAAEHLRTAATMYREMDMRFWLPQAEAESRVLG